MLITKLRDFGHKNMSNWVNSTLHSGCWEGPIHLDLTFTSSHSIFISWQTLTLLPFKKYLIESKIYNKTEKFCVLSVPLYNQEIRFDCAEGRSICRPSEHIACCLCPRAGVSDSFSRGATSASPLPSRGQM